MSISPSHSEVEPLVETVAEIAYEILLAERIAEIRLTPKIHSLVCGDTLYLVRSEDCLIPKIEELVQENSQEVKKVLFRTSPSWVMYFVLQNRSRRELCQAIHEKGVDEDEGCCRFDDGDGADGDAGVVA